MQTLSYGYSKPQNDDTGDVFFPALAANIQQLNDHIHDGVTSALIPTITQSIAHASWNAVSGFVGMYKQTVTLPTPLLYAGLIIQLRDVNGNIVNNRIDAASSNTYVVYTNDNTQDLNAEYGS